MTESHLGIPIHVANEQILADLAWTIELAVGEFSLHVWHCNYVHLQTHLAQRLQHLCPVDIHIITLEETTQTLYTTLKAALGETQPAAVMILGLESVDALEQMLAATDLAREEFRKNCHFPLILWFNTPTLAKFRRLAPNFASWAGVTTELAIAPDTLRQVLIQTLDQLFNTLLTPNVTDSFTKLVETLKLGSLQRFEISDAFNELIAQQIELPAFVQADVDFARGLNADNNQDGLIHFQRSLTFWDDTKQSKAEKKTASRRQTPEDAEYEAEAGDEIQHLTSEYEPLKHGVVLYFLGRYRYSEAIKSDVDAADIDWMEIQIPVQESLKRFKAAKRLDLVAKCMTLFQRVLQKRQVWGLLKRVSERGIGVHQTYGTPRRLSQDYGFLARVALEQRDSTLACQYAQQALDALGTPSIDQQWLKGLYLLFLGQAKAQLGEIDEAIADLETAADLGDPGYYTTYLIILHELHRLYWQKKRYLKAFRVKRSRLSIEQQYGLRAFVGAGRLKPQKEQVLEVRGARETHAHVNADERSEEQIADEIRVSGRSQDLENLLRRTTDNTYKLTVIYGGSGVGKSSLIHAGFVPALKQRSRGVRDNLPVLIRKYTTDWLSEVAYELTAALKEETVSHQYLETTSPATINDSPSTRVNDVLEQLRQNDHSNLRTILIFDQFEEFFFANPDALQRRRFFEFMGECLQIPLVNVFLSLREDYIHYLLECHRLPSIKKTGID
ncbi:MAG: AAA family ATPase, partial [Cyanobacteria bacterium J06633_2]